MSKGAIVDGTREADARVAEMLKRYVRDQRASAAIVVDAYRPLQQRLASVRA
jgi:hypothetical protein